MKIIRYDNPQISNVKTFLNQTTEHNDNEIIVGDSSNLSIGDFILIEDVGHEKFEIVKILGISGNTLSITPLILPHNINVSITVLNYDSYKITRKDTPTGSETTVIQKQINYAHPHNLIEYFDFDIDASDLKYYSIYYVNSETTTEDLQTVLHEEENYGYISIGNFRRETSFTSSEVSDGEVERAIWQAFEWIRDNIYVYQEFDADFSRGEKIVTVDTPMVFADWNGDRKIDKNDIIVYEFDSPELMRKYLSHKIIKVNEDTKKIFFSEPLPTTIQNNIVIKIPLTFNNFDFQYMALSNVSKLIATNMILRDVDISKIKSGITSWTAGGTSVNRDVNNIKDSIEKNLASANTFLNQLRKIYMRPTRLRTDLSSLNVRGRNRGFASGYEGLSRRF